MRRGFFVFDYARATTGPLLNHAYGVGRMEFLYRLLDRLDTWFTAGLVGAFAASWWHRDDLVDRKAWAVFIFSGAVCAHYRRRFDFA